MYDIIVIGGGTAGLTAAVYARRAGKSVLLLEKEAAGGQIVYSPRIENYPGLPSVSGADFAAALAQQAEGAGTVFEYAEALSLTREDGAFAVRCDTGVFRAKALILALGTAHRRLGLENEEDLIGCGVSYCAVCDGAFYRDREAAVLGGGSTALTDALFLTSVCKKVTLIHRRNEFRGESALVERLKARPNAAFLLSATVTALKETDGSLTGITVTDVNTRSEREVPLDGLFIAIGQDPQTDILRGFLPLGDAGYIPAGEDCACSVKGVFAAGDCRTKKVRQLTTAAADGAAAAIGACAYVDSLS